LGNLQLETHQEKERNAYMSSFTKDRTASHASLSASFERWYTVLSPELVMFAASSLAGTTGRMY
jgi:hypothetical protein